MVTTTSNRVADAARGAAMLAVALCALAACEPKPAVETVADASTCPDDGPRLALTGLCKGRAINWMDPNLNLISDAPDGCSWVVTETAFPDGDVLLYRALTCNGVETALEFHGGAHSAALGYTKSAQGGDALDDVEPVRIFISDPADPQKVIRDLFEGIPEDQRADCEIRPAGIDFWPTDALSIALKPEARAKLPMDEPVYACGEFGHDEDSASFWRISQGYAWFFALGQDSPEIDPASFTLMRKEADGSWAAIP